MQTGNNKIPNINRKITPIIYFIDEKVAIDALYKQGFTDVNITDKSWLFVGFRGCSEDDSAILETIP